MKSSSRVCHLATLVTPEDAALIEAGVGVDPSGFHSLVAVIDSGQCIGFQIRHNGGLKSFSVKDMITEYPFSEGAKREIAVNGTGKHRDGLVGLVISAARSQYIYRAGVVDHYSMVEEELEVSYHRTLEAAQKRYSNLIDEVENNPHKQAFISVERVEE